MTSREFFEELGRETRWFRYGPRWVKGIESGCRWRTICGVEYVAQVKRTLLGNIDTFMQVDVDRTMIGSIDLVQDVPALDPRAKSR